MFSTAHTTPTEMPDVDGFRRAARGWLSAVTTPRVAGTAIEWNVGEDDVSVFDSWSREEEARRVYDGREWERQRYEAGWGAIAWPTEFGGRGLPELYAIIYEQEEQRFDTPKRNELFEVTRQMIAPTIARWGTDGQKERFVRALLRTDLLCCQLFSEPNAGSDLASLTTRAVRDCNDWIISGQKVWTSGATSAEWGEAICRTDHSVPRHSGMTAFLIPMDAPGVTVRPIRQMTGGSSFSEVFLDDVRVSDNLRLGPVGAGWKVALTTLAAERFASQNLGGPTINRVLGLADHIGARSDRQLADEVTDLSIRATVNSLNGKRVAQSIAAGQDPGPIGSIGRLSATRNMRRTSDLVSRLLGAKLVADTAEWGTYAWSDQVLGAPGYRIAGGSEEIQKNIIAERVLGLPREPRVADS